MGNLIIMNELSKSTIADLHLHSRFSRACSKNITIKKLEEYAKIKGINLLGTSDFAHPKWNVELKQELIKNGIEQEGIYYTENKQGFIFTTEFSFMYKDETNGERKSRKIHLVVLAPSVEIVDQIIEQMLKHGRVDYDGRPIFGISCEQFVDEMMSISKDIEIIPAHAWTPWFGIFGAKSGYDNLKDCFKSQTKNIHAVETGLSSDIEMNRRCSFLNDTALVSFSDSHSFWPQRLGRESTIFSGYLEDLTYKKIIKEIRNNSFDATIEVSPEYGKYHFNGHLNCRVSFSPEESKKHKNICPKCKKELTIGVQARVDELADQKVNQKKVKKYYKLLPLHDLISFATGKGISTKEAWRIYNMLVADGRSEFDILINLTGDEIRKIVGQDIGNKLSSLILKARKNELKIIPGYDGLYGKIID